MTARAASVTRATLAVAAVLLAATLAGHAQAARPTPIDVTFDVESWRPAIHFTPPRHFMNDPNGLVFYEGEYHLFYQHNPFGPAWGHMSWGHAVSPDLVHWKDLPVALRERDGWMIFSGSAVVDETNTSGLCEAGRSCLVAIYTMHREARQAQGIAASRDHGRTWTPYPGNPVLDLGLKDFRDPKVLWHAPTRQWVMAAVVPDQRQVRFFGSPDLETWTPLSSFGPAGATRGIWECPTLMQVPVEGQPRTSAWVLAVSVSEGAPAGGTGVQYFVGDFDGKTFTAPAGAEPAWADHGPDFYAAQNYAGLPDAAGRAVWIGWMSNWQYANDEPTGAGGLTTEPNDVRWFSAMSSVPPPGPWRGAMTIARDLRVRRGTGPAVLVQSPVGELLSLRVPRKVSLHTPDPGDRGSLVLGRRRPPAFAPLDIDVEVTLHRSAFAGVRIEWGNDEYADIAIDAAKRELWLDRTHVGLDVVPKGFARIARAPLTVGTSARLRLLVDRSSIEVFANEGATVLTARVFPSAPSTRRVRTISDGRGARVTVKESVVRVTVAR